jgi:hypothetical protein
LLDNPTTKLIETPGPPNCESDLNLKCVTFQEYTSFYIFEL